MILFTNGGHLTKIRKQSLRTIDVEKRMENNFLNKMNTTFSFRILPLTHKKYLFLNYKSMGKFVSRLPISLETCSSSRNYTLA